MGAAALLLVATWSTGALAEVQVRLTAHKVTQDAKGIEKLAPASEIKPGELVEYRAVYHNDGDSKVQKLFATMPIPVGTEFLPKTASPAGAMASLDGTTFSPMPLKRKVRLADGRLVDREVPASEYRYLRWSLGTLASKQEEVVRARVRVEALLTVESSTSK
jgi:uncharacterized repeat protein (TIGR01451 family)